QKAKEGRPDVILLDVIMPGMDGFETCRQLKAMQETLHIPVILFTASQETHLDETARKAGADRVVQKPFVDQAYQAIVEILGPL
ncbi:MAG TPA: response regulator, partial [Candidatus Omnitrophota bacterium]|nr:response regulator [Candidatus Omnitrophota bacterium]